MKVNQIVPLLVTVVLFIMLSGCAKAPEAEREAAFTAMAASRTAGAERYVPADYTAAKALWDTSEALLKLKKYEKAKQGYMEAKAAFEKATGGVDAMKQALIPQAAAAVTALEGRWKDFEVTANDALGRSGNRSLWEVDSKSFLAGLKTAKELVAVDPTGAMAKVATLQGFFDTYGLYFKKLAEGKARETGMQSRKRNVMRYD